MKTLVLIVMLISFCSYSQDTIKKGTIQVKKKELIFDSIKFDYICTDQNYIFHPLFPGGDSLLNHIIISNFKYPDSLAKNNIAGQCLIDFHFDINGRLLSTKVHRVIGGKKFKEETERVLKLLPEYWIPTDCMKRALENKNRYKYYDSIRYKYSDGVIIFQEFNFFYK